MVQLTEKKGYDALEKKIDDNRKEKARFFSDANSETGKFVDLKKRQDKDVNVSVQSFSLYEVSRIYTREEVPCSRGDAREEDSDNYFVMGSVRQPQLWGEICNI